MSVTDSAERLKITVAEEVRVALARRQMSGVKLAELINRSQVYVSRRLRGEVAFDVMDLALVADALGVSVLDLMPKKSPAEYFPGERVIATVGAERPTRHRSTIPTTTAGPPTRPVTRTHPTSRLENQPLTRTGRVATGIGLPAMYGTSPA